MAAVTMAKSIVYTERKCTHAENFSFVQPNKFLMHTIEYFIKTQPMQFFVASIKSLIETINKNMNTQ